MLCGTSMGDLTEIRTLLDKAKVNMSEYKKKYNKYFELQEKIVKLESTQGATVDTLKKSLSLHNDSSSVYFYDEDTLVETGVELKNSEIVPSGASKTVTVKQLKELLNEFQCKKSVIVDNKILTDVLLSDKKDKVFLSLKNNG